MAPGLDPLQDDDVDARGRRAARLACRSHLPPDPRAARPDELDERRVGLGVEELDEVGARRRDVEGRAVLGDVEERHDEVHAHGPVAAGAHLGDRVAEGVGAGQRAAEHPDAAGLGDGRREARVQGAAEPRLLDRHRAPEQARERGLDAGHPTRSRTAAL